MDLVIIGAGGFGREVLDVVQAVDLLGASADVRRNCLGFIDDGIVDGDRLDRIDSTHLGGSDDLPRFEGARFVVGVGNPAVREQLAARAVDAGLVPLPALVHPDATIGADVTLGDGSVVCAGVRVTTNVRVGEHVHLNINSTVGHDAIIEDYVTVNPLAAISGDVRLGRGVTVGTTACVNQGLAVGAGAVVGSGAAAVKDTRAGVTVVGVPARERGQTITRQQGSVTPAPPRATSTRRSS